MERGALVVCFGGLLASALLACSAASRDATAPRIPPPAAPSAARTGTSAPPSGPAAVAEPVPAEWDKLAPADALAPDARIASVVLFVQGDLAFPLYCFEARHRVLHSGAPCLRNAPRVADLSGAATSVRARLVSREMTCIDGPESKPEYLPAYRLPAAGARGARVLLLTVGADPPPRFEPVAEHTPLSRDLAGVGGRETISSDESGLFVSFGASVSEVTRRGERGPYDVLAVADLDGDGAPELVAHRDLGTLWEFVASELRVEPPGSPSFRGVNALGCGELG